MLALETFLGAPRALAFGSLLISHELSRHSVGDAAFQRAEGFLFRFALGEFLVKQDTILRFLDYLTMRDEQLREFPDSGETLTIDGMMIRIDKDTLPAGSPNTGRMIWLINSGKRQVVPTVAVAEVLGGAKLITTVPASILDTFEVVGAPASVEGRMVKLENESEVWVIHERESDRVTDLAISRLGGWQQIAIVRSEVLGWFPNSGRTIH